MARIIALLMVCLGVATLFMVVAGFIAWSLDASLWWWPNISFGAFLLEGVLFVICVAIEDLGSHS